MPHRMTSESHPLRIAAISAGSGGGQIGVTFCPGKYDTQAHSGFWDRNLKVDIGEIRNWGAEAVVTLLRPHELELLRVKNLGIEIAQSGIKWFHLPITDVSIPDDEFEGAWTSEGRKLRQMLAGGSKILIHCRGGLGRAGTIAAKLLIEMGAKPQDAIRSVRNARPGAIETSEQERYLQRCARIER